MTFACLASCQRLKHVLAWIVIFSLSCGMAEAGDRDPDAGVADLAREVATRGWILFSARTSAGDYDLFVSRPGASNPKNLTRTKDFDEYGGRFSPDGRRILYRRRDQGVGARPEEAINHDLWGATGVLVVAAADGTEAQAQGVDGAWPWASWSPDGQQIACLYRREGLIRIVDLASKKIVREFPRQGLFQQMYWSPDGARLCGTANLNGQDWNVVSLELASGKRVLLTRALNCTGDWFQGDPQRVIYSHRMPGLGTAYGWTMLMHADADGKRRDLIYGERGRHIYYGCTSPDDRYVLFSRPESDGGTDADMAIMRLADAPIIVPDDYVELRSLYPKANSGPLLRWPQAGFEPHWTYAEPGGE